MTLVDQIGVGLGLVGYMRDILGMEVDEEQEDEIVEYAIVATEAFSIGDFIINPHP